MCTVFCCSLVIIFLLDTFPTSSPNIMNYILSNVVNLSESLMSESSDKNDGHTKNKELIELLKVGIQYASYLTTCNYFDGLYFNVSNNS